MCKQNIVVVYLIISLSLIISIGCQLHPSDSSITPLGTFELPVIHETSTIISATIVPIRLSATPEISSVLPLTLTESPPITPTLTKVPAPILTPNPIDFSLMCSTTEPETLTKVNELNGILAYSSLDNASWQNTDDQINIIKALSLQLHTFPPFEDIELIGFSPDENWFAFAKSKSSEIGGLEPFIYLISPNGETIETPISIQDDPYLYWFGTWISNQLIMIQTLRFPESGLGSYSVDSFLIYDAFTGEDKSTLFNLLPNQANWLRVYFSPDMTRAVYFSDPRSTQGESIVLWDMERQKVLWSAPFQSTLRIEERYLGYLGFNQTAFWAPDSTAFVYTNYDTAAVDEPLYKSLLIDRDGLEEYVLISSVNMEDTMALGGLWSPDSRFIYYFFPENSYVYDVALNQVTQLCANYSTLITWSLDSNFLVYLERIENDSYLLLFNIVTGEIQNIGKVQAISGLEWLENEDWLNLSE